VIGLDTNVLVRYLAQDDRRQAAKALQLIEKECSEERAGFVSGIALAQLVWVLESCYGSGRSEVVGVLQRILRARQLVVQDAETVWKAVRLFETSKADFADCLIACIGARHECEYTATFDKVAADAGMRLID
jgi:predicted nucleic-acid-binding protein